MTQLLALALGAALGYLLGFAVAEDFARRHPFQPDRPVAPPFDPHTWPTVTAIGGYIQ